MTRVDQIGGLSAYDGDSATSSRGSRCIAAVADGATDWQEWCGGAGQATRFVTLHDDIACGSWRSGRLPGEVALLAAARRLDLAVERMHRADRHARGDGPHVRRDRLPCRRDVDRVRARRGFRRIRHGAAPTRPRRRWCVLWSWRPRRVGRRPGPVRRTGVTTSVTASTDVICTASSTSCSEHCSRSRRPTRSVRPTRSLGVIDRTAEVEGWIGDVGDPAVVDSIVVERLFDPDAEVPAVAVAVPTGSATEVSTCSWSRSHNTTTRSAPRRGVSGSERSRKPPAVVHAWSWFTCARGVAGPGLCI